MLDVLGAFVHKFFLLSTVGGSQNLRTYWNQYLKNAHIMVFVVDSTDDKRLQLARQELHRLLEESPQLPLMVLANKQVNISWFLAALTCGPLSFALHCPIPKEF